MSGGIYLRYGLGAGFEVQAGLESPYIALGLGGSVGFKLQAPLEGPVNIALSSRLAGVVSAGVGDRSFTVLSTQTRLLTTFNLTDELHLTIAPTFMFTYYRVEHKETTSASDSAVTTGGSVGMAFDVQSVTYHTEVSTLLTPSREGVEHNQWVVIPAVGVSF